MGDRYALRDHDDTIDGRGTIWWVYLGTAMPLYPFIVDTTDTRWPLEEGLIRGWWQIPSHVGFDPERARIECAVPPRQRTVSYRRAIEAPGYPETLTVEQFIERSSDESPDYDRRFPALYEPVQEEVASEPEVMAGPWLVLDGAPPPDDPRVWTCKLPFALANRPEYRHLFPGHLEGFREVAAAALGAMANVRVLGVSSHGPLSVYIEVSVPRPTRLEWDKGFDPSSYSTVRDRQKARLKFDAPKTVVSHHLEVPVPSRIEGADRADATRAWDDTLLALIEAIDALRAQPCPTCKGHGWIDEAGLR